MTPEPQPPTLAEWFLIVASLLVFAAAWAAIARRGRVAGRHAVARHLAGLFGGGALWFLAMLVGIGTQWPGTVAVVSLVAAIMLLPKPSALGSTLGAHAGKVGAEWQGLAQEWHRFRAETKDAWHKARNDYQAAQAEAKEKAHALHEATENRLRAEREDREKQRLIALETLPARLRAQGERAAEAVRELRAKRELEESSRRADPNYDTGIRLLRSPSHLAPHHEDGDWDGPTDEVGPERVAFTYSDAFGNVTDREVIVHRADRQYFAGYCMEREAERTFRYDRIVGEVVRTDTGEALSATAWMRELTR